MKILLTFLIIGSLLVSCTPQQEDVQEKITPKQVKSDQELPAYKPAESVPLTSNVSPQMKIPNEPCLFGVVFFSYYSASEHTTHKDFVTSDIIPEDSLNRSGQEALLETLSKDCGPVGANVSIIERKIVHAQNKRDAHYKRIDVLNQIVEMH